MMQILSKNSKTRPVWLKQLFTLTFVALIAFTFGCENRGGTITVDKDIDQPDNSSTPDNNKKSQISDNKAKCTESSYCRNEYCPSQDDNSTGTCGSNDVCECEIKKDVPLGSPGDYVSIHGSDKLKAIASYNSTYGDLVVKTFTGDAPKDSDIWKIVDGLNDSDEPTNNKYGFRKGITAPGPDQGKYTSVFVDGETIHIAYQGEGKDGKPNLRYARMTKDDVVEIATLDETPTSGSWTQILVIDNNVHIVHSIADDNGEAYVRHVTFEKTADINSLTAANLSPKDIGSKVAISRPCTETDGECKVKGMTAQCIIETGTCESPSGVCQGGCADGFSCIGGTCKKFYRDAAVETYPQYPGAYARLVASGDAGQPLRLTFFNGWTGESELWNYDGSNWTNEVGFIPAGRVSPHTSLAFDNTNNPVFVSMDLVKKNLDFTDASMTTQNLASGTTPNYNDPTGFFNRVFNVGGTYIVVYQYPSEKTFYVRKSTDGGGTWSAINDTTTFAPTDTLGARGFYLNAYATNEAVYVAAQHIQLKEDKGGKKVDVEVIKVDK